MAKGDALTVGGLMAILKRFPADAPVLIAGFEGGAYDLRESALRIAERAGKCLTHDALPELYGPHYTIEVQRYQVGHSVLIDEWWKGG